MINVLCPTRLRPIELQRMYESLCDTAEDPANVHLIIGMDAEDTASQETIPALQGKVRVTPVIGARQPDLSAYYNGLLWYGQPGIYHLASDDVRYRTSGWDTEVKKAFAQWQDGIGLVYARDRHEVSDVLHCATHPFLPWRWVVAVGYLTPPGMSRCIDTWLLEVAQRIGRLTYLPDVLIYSPTHQERTQADGTLRDLDARIALDTYNHAARADQRRFEVDRLTNAIAV